MTRSTVFEHPLPSMVPQGILLLWVAFSSQSDQLTQFAIFSLGSGRVDMFLPHSVLKVKAILRIFRIEIFILHALKLVKQEGS